MAPFGLFVDLQLDQAGRPRARVLAKAPNKGEQPHLGKENGVRDDSASLAFGRRRGQSLLRLADGAAAVGLEGGNHRFEDVPEALEEVQVPHHLFVRVSRLVGVAARCLVKPPRNHRVNRRAELCKCEEVKGDGNPPGHRQD